MAIKRNLKVSSEIFLNTLCKQEASLEVLLETFGNDENYFKKNPLLNLRTSERDLHRLEERGISVIAYSEDNYPIKLKKITNPPLILYHKGKLKRFEKCIAIVGKRNSTYFGRKNAREFAQKLAEQRYIIVSGLARGIDTEAHLGCLDSNGNTIAVLAGDVDSVYPPENRELAIDIANSGAIISEYEGGYQQKRFIERNRIISGLSECVTIVESDGTGGTAHQFNLAVQQHRPVFVLKPLDKSRISWKGYVDFVNKGGISVESVDELLSKLKTGLKTGEIGLNRYTRAP